MPWECKSVEESRMEFVIAVHRKLKSKSQLCQEYGITGDKCIKRYIENGDESNLSSGLHSQPLKRRAETEKKILETQGKEERFNQTLTKELLKFKTFENQQQAQEAFDTYREFYNHIRPHEAIDMEVPADRYQGSARKYPEKIKEWEYTGQCELRRIKNKGFLTYGGQGYFLSEALGTETVAIYPAKEDCVDVIFSNFRVAKIDLNEKFIVSKRCYLLKDTPLFSNSIT